MHYSEYSLCFNEAEKIMAKCTNILEFIGILQFSQTHLRLEINFSKEIEKMIATNFNETLMRSFKCIFSIMIAFNPLCNHFLSAVMLLAIFCNHAITVLSLRSLRFTTPDLVNKNSKVDNICKND